MSKSGKVQRTFGLKRLFRFRLATLLVFITGLGLWLGVKVPQARRQKAVVEAVLRAPKNISAPSLEYSYEFDAAGRVMPNAKPIWPQWLRNLFGDDFFLTVVGVSFDGTGATDANLRHLAGLPRLTRLDLEYCPITDEGIRYLASAFPGLVRLDLQATAVTDAGLRHVPHLEKLETLLLGDAPLTDAALSHLGGLKQLRHLAVRRTQVTGSGLKHLRGISTLRSLDLRDSPIMDSAVEHLRKLVNLRELDVQGTQLSNQAIEQLREALPACTIVAE